MVGIDIEDAYDADMSGYAVAGGDFNNGSYFDTVNQDALEAAIESILTTVATCDIDLSVAPPGPDTTQVTVDGTIYGEITEAECNNDQAGWYFSDAPTNQTITLCGQACTDFQNSGDANVEYFCEGG